MIDMHSQTDSSQQIITRLRQVLPRLREEYGVKRVGLFGSAARADMHADSDVDLVIEFEHPLGWQFMELADLLEKLLERPVDILTPAGIDAIRSPIVKQNIERSLLYV